MDASELSAIANPGKLVKSEDGFLCNSGRAIYTIKVCDETWLGAVWGVYTPEGAFLDSFHSIENAHLYVVKSADTDTPEMAARRRAINAQGWRLSDGL